MARPGRKLLRNLDKFVCVRITDMRGIDMNAFRFDYDLTFAAFFIHPDGTIYHRYGGRDEHDASSHLSEDSLEALMDLALDEHKERLANPPSGDGGDNPDGSSNAPQKLLVDDLPAAKQHMQRNPDKCIHCHQVHDFLRKKQQADGTWSIDELWMWPLPSRLGLTVNSDEQNRVDDVERDSPADAAGIKKRDEIVSVNGQPVWSLSDIQWVLHNAPKTATEIELVVKRRRSEETVTITLEDGWKVVSEKEISWRAYVWGISPKPGFGGPQLNAQELRAAGLRPGSFAFKVNYIVTWGDDAHTGRNAQQAGIRKNDIIVAIDGKSDFESVKHYHTWFRLTHKVDEKVTFEVLRNGRRQQIEMTTVK